MGKHKNQSNLEKNGHTQRGRLVVEKRQRKLYSLDLDINVDLLVQILVTLGNSPREGTHRYVTGSVVQPVLSCHILHADPSSDDLYWYDGHYVLK